MKNKKIKCDIYTRVSTTMQVDGYSLDAQKEKLKRYAEFQNMEIVNEYSDEGKSGKSVEGRPEFQRMLDNIENGTDEVQFVLVFKLSRFGRNAADVLNSLQRTPYKPPYPPVRFSSYCSHVGIACNVCPTIPPLMTEYKGLL